MIVPMQSVTLLCLASDREQTLQALRELGVMHLAPVQAPEGKELDQARAHLARAQRALGALPETAEQAGTGEPAEAIIENIVTLHAVQREQRTELEALRQERLRIAPYGSFDPQVIADLAKKHIFIKLYQLDSGQALEAPEGVVVHVLNKSKLGTYVAAIGRASFSLNAQELRMPERPLGEVERLIGDLEASLAASERRLREYAGDAAAIKHVAGELEDAVRFVEAREGMGEGASIAYVRGYCPVDAVEKVRSAAAQYGWGLCVADPASGEPVPTLIRNPRWVKPIKAVLDFMGVLPSYEEIDINAAFLVFLGIFFAMIVGDAGYGLIFIALTFWMRRKMLKAPAYPFQLLYIMSICTVAWGIITGTWFGAGRLPTLLNDMTLAWLKEQKNIMLLSFLLGAAHLTLAHLWVAIRMWNSPRALAQIGWIGSTWTMFFMACSFVVGMPLPGWVPTLFIVSVVLIVVFMTAPRDFKTEWFNHAMLPLSLVSNFVDLVSYIRLFAVGAAGFAVANSFNTMILGGGSKGVVAGLVAALLLFASHALNILLCVMGVLVHGVRLITLEFSSHIGMSWTGFAYKPFRRMNAGGGKQE